MLIAIDYDETYTAAPVFWDQVIKFGKTHGHDFICVTGRNDRDVTEFIDSDIKTIYTDGEYKKVVCRKLGISPDIWIDDSPGFIEPGRKLQWD